MKRLTFAFSLAALLSVPSASAQEPEPAAVWQLLREVTGTYESLDAIDYEFRVRSPEAESLMLSKTGGLVGTPEVRMARRNLANSLNVSFPALPPIFRAKAEEKAQREIESMGVFRVVREMGWTILGSFLRAIDAHGQYDVLAWGDAQAIVEFNDLGEPFMGKVLRSVRLTFDRRRGLITDLDAWFGRSERLDFLLTYQSSERFQGTTIPLITSAIVRQSGFPGPTLMSLHFSEGKSARSTAHASTAESWRTRLAQAGFARWQIERTRADAAGRLSMDFSREAITQLPPLTGLPIAKLILSNTRIADLRPLAGLPLETLILDDTPVTNLTPLAGLPLQRLSLRNVKATDVAVLGTLPLKTLCVAGVESFNDLALLAACPLEELDMEGRPISDLRPLVGKPLRELVASRTRVNDLGPLRGLPLRRLDINWNQIRDLSPLAECRELAWLSASGLPVEDLAPLSGLPLFHLRIGYTRVRDLAPLRGMPLRELVADNVPVSDLSPLTECVTLERFVAPRAATNLEVLRALPGLRDLSFRFEGSKDGPAQTVGEFWPNYAAELELFTHFVAAIRRAGFDATPTVENDGTFSLNLEGRLVADLSFLAGFPVSTLAINNTRVRDLESLRGLPLRILRAAHNELRDLTPLTGLPLTQLDLAGCPVSDLRPLAGMKLNYLALGVRNPNSPQPMGTKVSDLTPLRGMPFNRLAIDGTVNPDVTPLADCAQLEAVVLPSQVRNLDALRRAPKLRALSLGWPGSWEKLTPAAEFWKQQDAASAPRP